MASEWMMKGLLVLYGVIAVASVVEGNLPKALYWVSAAMITTSVLLMK